LFNTFPREEERFEPIEEGVVRMYTCGQTVYDDVHVGNARTYVYWDTLRRYLEWKGFQVFHVQNITDVGHLTDDADQGEDKVEAAAREQGLEPMALVERQLERYYRDMEELNVERHYVEPRATCHVPEMIGTVQDILDNGYGYVREGNVYFDVFEFDEDYGYADMANMDLDEIEARPRVEEDPLKRNQADFALWLEAPEEHIMQWDSQWSVGYPGWHLECTAMSQKYLGDTIDIHGGGKDHIFPHHPNERAQAVAATGQEFANYWLHAGFLTVEGEKMSKSEGNFYTAREVVEEFSGEALRMYYLSTHYRKDTDFSFEEMENAEAKLERVRNFLASVEDTDGGSETYPEGEIEGLKAEFEDAMDDDLNTPRALQSVMRFIKEANKSLDNDPEVLRKAAEIVRELCGVLGLELGRKEEVDGRVVDLLLRQRERLRDEGRFEEADEIRDELSELGIEVQDTDEGFCWIKKN